MENTYQVVIGDWSGDGHEKTETSLVKSNCSWEEINQAYEKGLKVLDLPDVTNEVADDYDDPTIAVDLFELCLHNITTFKDLPEFSIWSGDPTYVDVKEDEEKMYLGTEDYLELWLAIVRAGFVSTESYMNKYTDKEEPQTFHIGGYGFFY